ncbi:MAG TPA: trehalase family glycosidase [Rubrobacteraceae bacterium]|nr:trehalase family glycosidase [Rubrobacteraceae bacterium]
MAQQGKDDMLVRQAKAVLDFNWTGEYTQPGPRLYPHQWSWDSALIAIGYCRYDQERATRELRHLFEAQWKNGLLPQLVFNPHFTSYFPGPNFWHAKESPDAPEHRQTSGVVQPPVHATASLYIYRHAQDGAGAKEFLAYAYPKLKAWHDYLYRERDPDNEGLVYIRHPWESGMDNSPIWDQIFQRMHLRADQIPRYQRADVHAVSAADRPTGSAYDRFAYLVKFFADLAYDEEKIRSACPFLVQDVLFNSLLAKANMDLAELARIVGEDASSHEELAEKTRRAVDEKLWDEERGTYLDYDFADGKPIRVYFGPNLAGPLYAGIPDQTRAKRLVETLKNDGFGLADENVTPIPSYDMHGYGFFEERYWRGPVWININWFLMHGLRAYGYEDHAERLRRTIIDLCREEGFNEYFGPTSGRGLGSILFSWSAALLLDVLMEDGR